MALSSCRNTPKKSEEFILADKDSLVELNNTETNAIEEIYRNFSSPLEIANLFQVMGVPFSPDYLSTSIDANKQTTSDEKALYLGILGADLGYLNMYEKTGTSLELVSSIKKLAEGLNVGQFFNFEIIKRLSLNKSDLDSLLFMSAESFAKIDNYLRKNDHRQLSILMIAGVWIEAEYFATQVAKQYPAKPLRDRIGEQKNFVNDLLKIVSPYSNQEGKFKDVYNGLQEIAASYENVKISYTQGDPVSTKKDGGLIITQTESSSVEMTDKQLADIIDITGIVRNKLILNK